MAASRDLRAMLDRLAAAEERFLQSEFLAPVLRGRRVQVRIAGVVCGLRVEPADFQGWAVCRPTSATAACVVRPAGLAERQRYLELFPLLRLILCRREGDEWLATAAHHGDDRFRLQGPVPVLLIEEAQLFEVVETRFDGARCWFDRADPRRDPAAAAYLRQALREMVEPARLSRPGLTAEERAAYEKSYWPLAWAAEEAARDRTETKLRRALAHGGAELRGFVERDDCYRVEYLVDGERHLSVVDKRDLSVQVAGVCLSGEDHRFDLQSLVGVLREAGDEGAVRVGPDNQGIAEEQYWRVHPRRQE